MLPRCQAFLETVTSNTIDDLHIVAISAEPLLFVISKMVFHGDQS